jgi:hypothetical protein
MTELNIEYAPKTGNDELDPWNDRLVEFLRKYLSQPFDRGDPSAYDFTLGDLTTNGTWQDLDLSSIVPEDAIAVVLRVSIQDDATNNVLRFRKNGNSNTHSMQVVNTQVADLVNNAQFIVFCDTDRVIEYYATNTTWTAINIVVTGWFK